MVSYQHVIGPAGFGGFLPRLFEHRQPFSEQCVERRHQRHGHQYQFVLSQADGVLRFAYTFDADQLHELFAGYQRVGQFGLRAGNLINYAALTTISNSGVALSPSFIARHCHE